MEQNPESFVPRAATDEPASPATPGPASARADAPPPLETAGAPELDYDRHGHPLYRTEAEDDAYWLGFHAALDANAKAAADAPPEADAPFETRRARRARHDGLTGPKQALFLEELAAGATVEAAAKAAGISPTAAYNLRNRRAGRAFDIAWEAAIRRSRKVLADRHRDRVIEGQVSTRYDKDGNVVGTRHYHDNRLAMAVLTRLDTKAQAFRDDERLVTAVAEEFEELLDCIEEGGDAEAFVEECRPPSVQYHPAETRESDASIMARYKRLHRFDDVDPEDIDTSDLDPADRENWTDDQWDRAEASGFLDALPDEDETDAGESGEAARPERDDD
ncbi:MAG TPA: hypothetical protein VEW71_08055 [Allosphingosinicella sp.]|nr:hypothetical protein [Allosphingosinicella sp.]